MTLGDMKSLWGIPTVHLCDCRRRYQRHRFLIILTDILVIVLGTLYLNYSGVTFDKYGSLLLSVCIVFHFFYNNVFQIDNWEVCSFYYKNKKAEVRLERYNLTADTMYSILYCSGYKKLSRNKVSEVYMDAMLSACCQDKKYARSLARNLDKYKDASGNISCYILNVGKKCYLVDFASEDEQVIEEMGVEI